MKPLPWTKSPDGLPRFWSLSTATVCAWASQDADGDVEWYVWRMWRTPHQPLVTVTAPTFDEALAAADAAFRKLAAETIARHEREVAELKAVLG